MKVSPFFFALRMLPGNAHSPTPTLIMLHVPISSCNSATMWRQPARCANLAALKKDSAWEGFDWQ